VVAVVKFWHVSYPSVNDSYWICETYIYVCNYHSICLEWMRKTTKCHDYTNFSINTSALPLAKNKGHVLTLYWKNRWVDGHSVTSCSLWLPVKQMFLLTLHMRKDLPRLQAPYDHARRAKILSSRCILHWHHKHQYYSSLQCDIGLKELRWKNKSVPVPKHHSAQVWWCSFTS
jgi:hypothetical protein